jgi:hypothetical protein
MVLTGKPEELEEKLGETVSELRPPTGQLFIPQIYEYGGTLWNGVDRETRRTRRKTW